MSDRYPCGTLRRREFLAGLGAAAAALPAFNAVRASAAAASGDVVSKTLGKLGLPGPFPGRVVEARNASMIKAGQKNRAAIKTTLDRGLTALTGADDATSAWRAFFEAGDVVGIKVVPNGWPYAHTSHELVLEVIEGLKSAGVKTSDMFVYER